MKKILLFLFLPFMAAAVENTPITWNSSCASGAYNLAQQACLSTGSGGGVDSVTATDPVMSSGGVDPVISMARATSSVDGYLFHTDWVTFNSKQSALSFGNFTDTGTDGIAVSGGTGAVIGSGTSISQHVSDSSHSGYLSSADWSIFNGKQASGSYVTAGTGDVNFSGPGSSATTVINRALDRYIDVTNGSDSTGTGSQLRPWKSLNYAYSQVTDATRYNQYIFHLSGGEDTADVDPITAKPDISLTSDATFLILESFTISGTDGLNTGSEPFSVNNVLFLNSFSWVSNDTRALVMYATNTTFGGGSSIRQENAGGVLSVNFLNCLFEGSTNEFQVSSGVFASSVFVASNTTFDDGTGFLEIFGGYNASAFTLTGGVTALMSGIPCDAGNGCTMIFTTTGSGTPSVSSDSSSIPPTYTGSPTVGLTSNAVNEGYTPATSTNWSTVPTNVKAALDHLVVTQQSAVGSQPSCDSTKRGLQWLIQSTAGVADIFQICQQTVGGYAWVTH